MIQKHKMFKIALDCDDVLMPCISLAIDIINKKYNLNPPLKFENVKSWLPSGGREDMLLECFKDITFYESQEPYEGAVEFVHELSKRAELYILTSVPGFAMGTRANLIISKFLDIPPDHIIMTSSKDLVEIDMLLDDAVHNILTTRAKYPVIFRRPWNSNITGVLAVNNYEEFLCLVDEILNQYVEPQLEPNTSKIVCLVGVSGSGKTIVAEELVKTGLFDIPKSYTDRSPEADDKRYHFISTEKFLEMKNNNEIFESTIYAGYHYGSSVDAVNEILNAGKNVVIPVDMCGAMGFKANFENVVTIYVDRSRKDLIKSILDKNCSNEDKTNRIISMEAEIKNANICDYIIRNEGNINNLIDEILQMF